MDNLIHLIGEKLVKSCYVTAEQIDAALVRQKEKGGRLGANLVALGYITEECLNTFLAPRPPTPKNCEDTGFSPDFIAELALKTAYYLGTFRLRDVSERIKLPLNLVDAAVQALRQDKFVEVRGGTGYESVTYTFVITSPGRQRASELLEKCSYVGPAPVTLDAYRSLLEYQTVKNVCVHEAQIRDTFSSYVIADKLFDQLGPAVNSAKSIFLYGPPGNGKTAIAEAIGALLGEDVYIPYAVAVDSEVIRVFDPINHILAEQGEEPSPEEDAFGDYDRRWAFCRRPVVLVGGEMTLGMLDLDFNPISKYYEAPLQMKANGGIFIIDDFGRQLVRPKDLLNRWIVPLERRTDFLTLHTGKKFEIPFDQLVIFSTNIDPKELVDEAFLRRIRYKIKIDHPAPGEYKEIFRRLARKREIEFREEVVDYLLRELYLKRGIKPNACHPRDILDQIQDLSRYRQESPNMDLPVVLAAWENYFVEI